MEYAAFMIAREALGNALFHAGARHVQLRVDGDDGELRLYVDDDGIGMPLDDDGVRPGHLGLVGMRERALAIHARLSIAAPADGTGTQVCLHWTLQ